jgi:ketosteroid isomerase-like protein
MTERDRRNIEAVRGFYQQEHEYAADDIVWHVPGHNPVSGTYRGREEYFGTMVGRMQPLDRWELTLSDIMVNGDHVVATFSMAGERRGRTVNLRGAHLFRLDDGKIVEGRGFASDQDALDAFFAA